MEIDHKCIWCLHFVYSFYISFFTINHNNVAVKIVACWNRNVFTSSSLLWHWELVFTIHLRCDPPHSNSPVRSSILMWECKFTGRLIWFRSLKLTFSICFRVVVAQQWNGRDAVWGLEKIQWAMLGMVTEGGDWVVRPSHLIYAGCVCTLLWTDCFETYKVVTYSLCYL